MELILRCGYYGVTAIALPLILFFWLANLLGGTGPMETWRHKAIIFGSGATALGLVRWSFRVGQAQGHWIGAILLSAVAPVVFAILALGGMLLFTNIHWQ